MVDDGDACDDCDDGDTVDASLMMGDTIDASLMMVRMKSRMVYTVKS